MLHEDFKLLNTDDYISVKNRSKELCKDEGLEAIIIITLEDSDFEDIIPKPKSNPKYSNGYQFIFINKVWSRSNITQIGVLYPTSILIELDIRKICAFRDTRTADTLNTLCNTHYLMVPINNISFSKNKLSFTGSPIYTQKYMPYYSERAQTKIVINFRDVIIKNLFIQGINIVESTIMDIIMYELLDDSLPKQHILREMCSVIQAYGTTVANPNTPIYRSKPLKQIKWYNKKNLPKLWKDTEIGGPIRYSHSNNLSLIHVIWFIQQELILLNEQDEMEISDI